MTGLDSTQRFVQLQPDMELAPGWRYDDYLDQGVMWPSSSKNLTVSIATMPLRYARNAIDKLARWSAENAGGPFISGTRLMLALQGRALYASRYGDNMPGFEPIVEHNLEDLGEEAIEKLGFQRSVKASDIFLILEDNPGWSGMHVVDLSSIIANALNGART